MAMTKMKDLTQEQCKLALAALVKGLFWGRTKRVRAEWLVAMATKCNPEQAQWFVRTAIQAHVLEAPYGGVKVAMTPAGVSLSKNFNKLTKGL